MLSFALLLRVGLGGPPERNRVGEKKRLLSSHADPPERGKITLTRKKNTNRVLSPSWQKSARVWANCTVHRAAGKMGQKSSCLCRGQKIKSLFIGRERREAPQLVHTVYCTVQCSVVHLRWQQQNTNNNASPSVLGSVEPSRVESASFASAIVVLRDRAGRTEKNFLNSFSQQARSAKAYEN